LGLLSPLSPGKTIKNYLKVGNPKRAVFFSDGPFAFYITMPGKQQKYPAFSQDNDSDKAYH
jgi:hypothetical protein